MARNYSNEKKEMNETNKMYNSKNAYEEKENKMRESNCHHGERNASKNKNSDCYGDKY